MAQHYLNPLTFEAQSFLNALEVYSKTRPEVDEVLYNTLSEIVEGIEKFLSQKLKLIFETENTKLVTKGDMQCVGRLYHCEVCRLHLGCTVDKVALHLMNHHPCNVVKKLKVKKEAQKIKKENQVEICKLPKTEIAWHLSKDPFKILPKSVKQADKLKEIPEYQIIEQDLLRVMEPLFPDKTIKLYKFGSRISGIASRSSDLDIFVDIGSTFNSFENRASEKTLDVLQKVSESLRHHTAWKLVRSIDSARVPILRVCNTHTNIECDIGFSNSLAYCNTLLIEYLFELQPIARCMCLFFKKWLQYAGFTTFISTYSIILMVVFYLQTLHLLPSVEQLQTTETEELKVGPWVANFSKYSLNELNIKSIDPNHQECKKYIQRFCKFLANFKYETSFMCPYFGRSVKKTNLTTEMPSRYLDFLLANCYEKEPTLQVDKPLVVQDPLQLNHNVTKRMTLQKLSVLKGFLNDTALLMIEQNKK